MGELITKEFINRFKLPHHNAVTLVILNGIYHPELSDEFGKSSEYEFNQETLRIFKNAKIKKPIYLLFLVSQDCNGIINIIAEENCCFNLIEEYISINNIACAINIKINIKAKNNAEIIYYKLQTENSAATCNFEVIINQKQDSRIKSFYIGKGSKNTSNNSQVLLVGKNASYNAIGVILLYDSQVLNYKIRIEHLAPNCTSNILFKGIIADNATGDFNARVIVHPNMYKTETHVTNKNLLLCESATMHTAPELEIYTDDVICTHGATVGQLDQEALFYLRSRGVSEDNAIKLLTTAFAQEIIDQFDEHLKPKLENLL